MIRLGNFLFRYRNGIFPVVYLLLFVPGPAPFADFRLAALLGLLVAGLGQLIRGATVGLDYIVRGGRNRQIFAKGLVQGGLFAHCRNPLYLGNLLILVGLGLASNSLLFLLIALPFFGVAYAAIIAAEEAYLRSRFGTEFDNYCARVNRLWPRLPGLRGTLASMTFNWRRLITAEYGSAYIWVAAWTLVTLKHQWSNDPDAAAHPLFRTTLCTTLALATLGYLAARILKKGGFLEPPAQPQQISSVGGAAS